MKKTIFACLAVMAFMACSQKPQSGYTISGTAEGTVDGDTVYICEMQGFFSMVPLDSAYVKNGKFEFKGETEGAALRFLIPMHAGKPVATEMFILENADIKANLKPEGEGKSEWEPGPNGKLYQEYMEGEKTYNEQLEEPWRITLDSTATEAQKKVAQQTVDSLTKQLQAYHKKFIVDHVPSALSDLLFAYNQEDYTDAEKEEVLKLFGEKQPQYPYYKQFMAEREAEARTKEGAQYTDFEMPDTKGQPMKVSDFVGKSKYVLIDFWASWCGPCRAEMPAVIKAYDAFHQKGFEVVGVSLDNNKEAWLKAIDQLKLPWPQMSDVKGWDCEGAKLYNVRAIPANVLVDQQGKIIAKNLRGEDLYNKMAELLK